MDGTFATDGSTMESKFTQPLAWDTSQVTNMRFTFRGAEAFNQLLAWDTSAVTSMYGTFSEAKAFNQPLAWDTIQMTDWIQRYQKPLNWDTSKVFYPQGMFTFEK